MDGSGGGGGEETSSPSPVTSPSSEKVTSSFMHGKVKFFCSHGGKILPRPSDGTLKYVGGVTRVIAVPRSITFLELMKKIHDLIDGGEYVLKYQIASEDLDSLVSVKSNEDIHHFLDEYDRLERRGSKLRAYLFPKRPMAIEVHTPPSFLGPHKGEKRFIDAINGIVRPITNYNSRPSTGFNHFKSYSPSPTEGSPQSLSPRGVPLHTPAMNQDNLMSGLQNKLRRVQKVLSSPNLTSLDGTDHQNSGVSVTNNCVHHQQPRYYHNHGYQMPSIPLDHNVHSHHSPTKYHDHYSRHYPQLVSGGGDYGTASFSHGSHNQFFRPYVGSGGHSKWGHLEQYATPTYGNDTRFLRAGSPEV